MFFLLYYKCHIINPSRSGSYIDSPDSIKKTTINAINKKDKKCSQQKSKHHVDFYFLNCHHSFETDNEHKSHKNVCENKYFCNVIMPSEDTKILEFNQYQKSDKALFVIYEDLECLIEKIDGCKNNPENSYASRVGEHIPSSLSMSTTSPFKSTENKHDV